MPANICQYIKTCPIYQGKKEVSTTPLSIYKNVFCNRGLRGWNNCKQFMDYEKISIRKE